MTKVNSLSVIKRKNPNLFDDWDFFRFKRLKKVSTNVSLRHKHRQQLPSQLHSWLDVDGWLLGFRDL